MKSSKQIKSLILKRGNKLTNAEMVVKLGVPTMTFAGVLAAMKRKGELTNDFLKTDLVKSSKTKNTNPSVSNKVLTINFSKVAVIKKSELTYQLRNRIAEQNDTLISGRSFYEANAFDKVIENDHSYSRSLTEKSLSRINGLGKVFGKCNYIEII
jgi:putative NIF3 family GTP cyclohydrolase 1 type 2